MVIRSSLESIAPLLSKMRSAWTIRRGRWLGCRETAPRALARFPSPQTISSTAVPVTLRTPAGPASLRPVCFLVIDRSLPRRRLLCVFSSEMLRSSLP